MMTAIFTGKRWLASVLLLSTGIMALGCRPAEKATTNETAIAAVRATDQPTGVEPTPSQTEPYPIQTEPEPTPTEPELTQTEPDPTLTTAAATEPLSIQLGSPELTAGISGAGELTNEQISDWLADPENHRLIEPTLPAGLAAAQANIQGLDVNPLTKAKIELGRQLYFDTRLSSDGTISCASCHSPDEGYGAHTQFGVGVDGQTGNRNSPISYNRIVSGPQFWDGRADSLEAQAVGPIANPIEMGNTHEQAVATLKSISGYEMQFDKIFPDEGVTIDAVGKAIAAFERVIVTDTTPFDHYEIVRTMQQQLGDEIQDLEEEDPELYARYQAAVEGSRDLSESAKRGRELFFADRIGCTACHAGANFTDELYHNLGVGMEVEEPDLGRYEVTNSDADKGAFKTPTLRNVALSAPYMHDGSQATLEEVMEWYDQGGHPNPFLSDKVKKLDLTEEEEGDLLAFMKEALTSAFPEVCRDRLPQ